MNAMTGTLFKDQIYLVHFLGHSHGYCFETGKVARDCLCNAASTKDITKAMKKVSMVIHVLSVMQCVN